MSAPVRPVIKRARYAHKSIINGKTLYSQWMPVHAAEEVIKSQSNHLVTFWVEIDPAFTHVAWEPELMVIPYRYKNSNDIANNAILKMISQ